MEQNKRDGLNCHHRIADFRVYRKVSKVGAGSAAWPWFVPKDKEMTSIGYLAPNSEHWRVRRRYLPVHLTGIAFPISITLPASQHRTHRTSAKSCVAICFITFLIPDKVLALLSAIYLDFSLHLFCFSNDALFFTICFMVRKSSRTRN